MEEREGTAQAKAKANILVLDSPKSSEATEGYDYNSTPSYLNLGAAGA